MSAPATVSLESTIFWNIFPWITFFFSFFSVWDTSSSQSHYPFFCLESFWPTYISLINSIHYEFVICRKWNKWFKKIPLYTSSHNLLWVIYTSFDNFEIKYYFKIQQNYHILLVFNIFVWLIKELSSTFLCTIFDVYIPS